MRTTISFSATTEEAKKVRQLAKKRGFSTVSSYVRFLLNEDDGSVISEETLVSRVAGIVKLTKNGKLIEGKTMKDLVK